MIYISKEKDRFKNLNKVLTQKVNIKRYLLILGVSLGVVLCTFFVARGFGLSIENSNTNDNAEIQKDLIAPVDKATGKVNILLLGVDVEGLRTDTIIVASYDLDNNKVSMLSIPRDTRMYIGSRYQKINAAHAITKSGKIKGPQGSIEAVTRLTGIPINYYVEFSFSAFRNTIDTLGGVDFDVPRDMFYEDPVQNLYIDLKKGFQHLDGDKSEQLVRFRRYPEGDIARVKMQQSFLKAALDQKLNASIILKIPDLFKQLSNDINTNLTVLAITKYLPNLNDLKTENVQMYHLPGGYNDTDYGASYWICDLAETKTLIEEKFGYDSSKITINSADSSSKSKDTKTVSPKVPEKTQKPQLSDSPSIEPTTRTQTQLPESTMMQSQNQVTEKIDSPSDIQLDEGELVNTAIPMPEKIDSTERPLEKIVTE